MGLLDAAIKEFEKREKAKNPYNYVKQIKKIRLQFPKFYNFTVKKPH